MEARFYVIEKAVYFEYMLERSLSQLLELDDNNKSFSYNSSGLSFLSKINLLMDMKHIGKDDKEKLKKFAEVRNMFAHNIKVKTFSDAVYFDKSINNWINRNYKDYIKMDISNEDNNKAMIEALINDCIHITKNVIYSVIGEGVKDGISMYKTKRNDAFDFAINELKSKNQNSDNPDLISLSELLKLVEAYMQ